MAKPERKPMTFSIAPDVPPPVVAIAAERQQVGARVTKMAYRQLKARAALSGVTVQALVEQAISDFLAKPTN